LLPALAWAAQPLELVGVGYHLHYWTGQEEQAGEVAQVIPAALPRLQQALGLKSSGRIDLYIARTGEEFRQLTQGADPNTTLGEALPQHRRIVLQPVQGQALRTVTVHELTHVLLADKVAGTGLEPPRWLHEGLAKYASNDYNLMDRELLTDAVNNGRLIPLAQLDPAFDRPETVGLAYAESCSIVDFLAGLNPAGLAPFLQQLGEVGDVPRALLRAYGLTPEAFARQWHERLVLQYIGRSNYEMGTDWIWAGMVVLFLVAFAFIRRRGAAIRRKLEEEDRQEEGMMGGYWRGRNPASGAGGPPHPEDSDERNGW
jgi:hypothetical protein